MENAALLDRTVNVRNDEHSSGLSWGAVIGGAFVTAAISLILLALGAGFGLSAVSPWSNTGASSSAVDITAICWLIVIEIISCALGGYLTGRLRTKWVAVHTDEVFFRDTANGFLVWAVSLVITVTFLVSAAATMVGESAHHDPSSEGGAMVRTDPNSYFVDTLFRADASSSSITAPEQAEAGRTMMHALREKGNPPSDVAYLSKLVAAQTGLSPSEAENRVLQVLTDARQAEDTARRTASHFLLWMFLALLIGAFSASYAATIGGRQRDHVKAF